MKRWILTLAFILSIGFVNLLFSEQPVPSDDGVGGGSRQLYHRVDEQCRKEITYNITIAGYTITVTEIRIGYRIRCLSGGAEVCSISNCDA